MPSALSAAIAALERRDLEDAASELSLALLAMPDGDERRALPLHVLALVEFELGTADGPRVLLAEAAAVERASGLEIVALHTSHQLALLTQSGATLGSVGGYYKETFETLTSMGNRQGAALCLKSMAEMYLAHGKRAGARGLLDRGHALLATAGDPAAGHVAAWLREIGELGG